MHMRFWGATLGPQPARRPRNLRRHPAPAAPARRRAGRRPARWPCKTSAAWKTSRARRCWSSCASATTRTPLGNDHRGTVEGIDALTIEDIRQRHKRLFRPRRHHPVRGRQLRMGSRCATRWNACSATGQGDAPTPPTLGPPPARARPPRQGHWRRRRSPSPTPACRSATPITTPRMGAVNVLSGGMSSRLFTEVREKRGLCYAVWAQLSDLQGPGQRHLLRRHHQRARPGDARRDAGASCGGCRKGSRWRRWSACRPA